MGLIESHKEFVTTSMDGKERVEVEVDTQNLSMTDERTKRASNYIRNAGLLFEEDGTWTYVGSAAVHYYRHNTRPHTYTNVDQTLFGPDIEEGFAWRGIKLLLDKVKSLYREVKTRKVKK